jgi:hypothetical protein
VRALLALVLAVVACTPALPPPVFPRLATTAPEDEGTIVVALAGGLGMGGGLSGGWGLEARVLWQQSADVELGAAVAVGKVDQVRWFVAPRLLAAVNPGGAEWTVLGGGVGLGVTGSGLVYLNLHVSALLGVPNDYAVPLLGGGAGLTFALLRGVPFGGTGVEDRKLPPARAVHVFGEAGVAVPIAGGNAVAVEVAVSHDLEHDVGMAGLLLGDRQRVAE